MARSSADSAQTPIAIGGQKNLLFVVRGAILGEPITARFRAPNKDAAIKQAHERGIRVATCEVVKPMHQCKQN